MREKIPGHDWAEGEVLRVEELRVGDLVMGYQHPGGPWIAWAAGGVQGIKIIAIESSDDMKYRVSPQVGRITGYEWLVKSRGGKSPAPKPMLHWNGRCPKCGKNTYTGFATVEHEGGSCP